MNHKSINVTRREFLRSTAGVFVSTQLMAPSTLQAQSAPLPSQPSEAKLARKSVVVRSRSPSVSVGRRSVRLNILRELYNTTLTRLAKVDFVKDAWASFLQPDDVVGLKCDGYGASRMGTVEPFVRLLVGSLVEAGWEKDQIIIAGASEGLVKELGTKPMQFGWTAEIDFGSGKDQLSSFVDQVTAIINVPILKTDNIAGISGCLKNVTYHMLKHPARYHANGCTPYLADVFALPQIRGKLRLNIVNGIRTVFDNGPFPSSGNVDNSGLLLMGTDPVAVDIVAVDELNVIRQERDLEIISLDEKHLPSLFDAGRKDLGHVSFRKIERLSGAH